MFQQIKNFIGSWSKSPAPAGGPALTKAAAFAKNSESNTWKTRGDDYLDQENLDEAVRCYRHAIAIDPSFAAAFSNLGLALMDQGLYEEAEHVTQQAAVLNPELFNAYYILGSLTSRAGRTDEAINHFKNAISVKPDFAAAYGNIGNLLLEQGQRKDALIFYQKAIAFDPAMAEAHYHIAIIVQEAGDRHEAIRRYRQALKLSPGLQAARINLLHQLQQVCEWAEIDSGTEMIRQQVREAPATSDSKLSPFAFLALPHTTASEQKACAEKWGASSYGTLLQLRKQLNFTFGQHCDGKIRIGYLSADFHDHATAVLMVAIFELHDRQRFHITAYSYGPDDQSPMRKRLLDSFDRFIDIRNESLVDSAKRIHADGIDILVDLKGYTGDSRSGILALRPAPVQVNFLGYPGTMGADFVDYLIADCFVIPPESQQHYSEKIAYLPHCYQPNDRNRTRPPAPTRESQKLPETAIVFCCFNQTYKITEDIFEIWCRLLVAVPDSILWLLSNTSQTEANLKREAVARGIADERLLFAPRVAAADHLARLQCADLFLDTRPYNAHTTCSEALWMGLPVITCCGETFPSRVAGSLLTALDLPELITYHPEDYYALALMLATNPAKRSSIKNKVIENGQTSALFDSSTFTRDLEAIFEKMHASE